MTSPIDKTNDNLTAAFRSMTATQLFRASVRAKERGDDLLAAAIVEIYRLRVHHGDPGTLAELEARRAKRETRRTRNGYRAFANLMACVTEAMLWRCALRKAHGHAPYTGTAASGGENWTAEEVARAQPFVRYATQGLAWARDWLAHGGDRYHRCLRPLFPDPRKPRLFSLVTLSDGRVVRLYTEAQASLTKTKFPPGAWGWSLITYIAR